MRAQEFVSEIERIAARDYQGGKDYLGVNSLPRKFNQLPGGSGFLYSIEDPQEEPYIRLWDPKGPEARRGVPQLIGKLNLEKPWGFPLPGALQVGTITVDEDYRGRGLAKSLYGIVLTIMKRPLVAGGAQTPGGRQNWVSLSQIPGVEMKGYISLDEDSLTTHPDPTDNWDKAENRLITARIDTIMGKLGGQYIGASPRSGNHYFAFDVAPTTSGRELQAHVKQNLARVYDEGYNMVSGLYAVWTGQ